MAKKTSTASVQIPAPKATKAAAKPAAKPAPKATPKPAPKPAAKPAVKAEKNGHVPADLTKPQVRVLKVLAKGKALTRKQIATQAPLDLAWVGDHVGSHNPEVNARPTHANCLVNKGYVKLEEHDTDGKNEWRYAITANGRKALERALKAE